MNILSIVKSEDSLSYWTIIEVLPIVLTSAPRMVNKAQARSPIIFQG